MQLDPIDYRFEQSNETGVQSSANEQSQITPARRAALDALEREFRDLLQAVPR